MEEGEHNAVHGPMLLTTVASDTHWEGCKHLGVVDSDVMRARHQEHGRGLGAVEAMRSCKPSRHLASYGTVCLASHAQRSLGGLIRKDLEHWQSAPHLSSRACIMS